MAIPETEKMPLDVWHKAGDHFNQFHGTDPQSYKPLDEFLGQPLDYDACSGTHFRFEAEVARKVKLLAGPHWRTVLKAHYAADAEEDAGC